MTQTPSDDPGSILAQIDDELRAGARLRKSALHTLVVGTADGALRVMVLRNYDADRRLLRFHTDMRSPKVAAIADDPVVNLLGYDAGEKVQLRMRGAARVECTGPVADAAWAASTNFAKRCYLAQMGPGAPVPQRSSGLPLWAEGINPSDDQLAGARENFGVLLVAIERIDWLYLANSGHRRAEFVFPGNDFAPQFSWLAP